MANSYAFRYRFFFRSSSDRVLYPKLWLRLLIYFVFTAAALSLMKVVITDEVWSLLAHTATPLYSTLVYLGVCIFGEWMLRMHLLAEETGKDFLVQLVINVAAAIGVPFIGHMILVVLVYTAGWVPEETPVLSVYWMLAGMEAAVVVAFVWPLLHQISRRYFPFTDEESTFLCPMSTHFVLAKRKQKEFMQWYERDAFDEALFDAKHAGEFSEEAYHEYRMDIARSYLDVPPYGLEDPGNTLLMDVVFVLLDEDGPDLFVNDCALTIHHGELTVEEHDVGPDGRQLHIRYGEKSLRLPADTGYSAMNRLIVKIARLVSPGYGIRECRVVDRTEESYFMSLPATEWKQLETEYGKAKMKRYFTPVDADYKGLSYYDTWWSKVVAFLRLPITHRY